jgi:hypothetical protein
VSLDQRIRTAGASRTRERGGGGFARVGEGGRGRRARWTGG